MKLSVSVVEKRRDFTIIDCRGELDTCNRDLFRSCLKILTENGPKKLVINISGITYIDCSGLSVFVGSLRKLKEDDGDIVLCGHNPFVSRIMKATRLDQVFNHRDNINEAIALITNPL